MNIIETDRLILKLYTAGDRGNFVALLTDERVMRYVDKGVMSPEAAGALWRKMMDEMYPRGVDTIWAVFARGDGRYIGNASIRPMVEKNENWEIGYYLVAEEWGAGLGTELAKRLVEYGFNELGLNAVYATVDYENGPSRKILEKAGLRFYEEAVDEQGPFCVYRLARG
jgi:RimJ/RimL family protein N-acetyltransferase